MKKQVPLTAVIAIALVIVTVLGYMLLIRPKRAEAGRLDNEIAALETKIQAAEIAAREQPDEKIKVADLFELAKAMPDQEDMPGIILELNSVASASGIRFVSIAPQAPAATTSYRALPIGLTFEGNYYDLTDFLFRLRNLVSVRDGELTASGRLFTLDSLDLHEGPKRFPQIQAVFTLSAYVFGAAPAPAPAPAPTAAPAGEGSPQAAGAP